MPQVKATSQKKIANAIIIRSKYSIDKIIAFGKRYPFLKNINMIYLSFAILHVRRHNEPIAQKYLAVCCGEIKSTDLTLASNPLMSILTGELYYFVSMRLRSFDWYVRGTCPDTKCVLSMAPLLSYTGTPQ